MAAAAAPLPVPVSPRSSMENSSILSHSPASNQRMSWVKTHQHGSHNVFGGGTGSRLTDSTVQVVSCFTERIGKGYARHCV